MPGEITDTKILKILTFIMWSLAIHSRNILTRDYRIILTFFLVRSKSSFGPENTRKNQYFPDPVYDVGWHSRKMENKY